MANELTWKQKNKDKWNLYSRLWRKKRKEELSEYYTKYNAKWRHLHPERYLLHKARGNAKRKNIEFNLTEEDIEIPEFCPVLNIPLKLEVGKGKTDNSPSIDRFDNSKGYTKDNIQVISWRANNLKSNGNLDEFRRLVQWLEQNGESS